MNGKPPIGPGHGDALLRQAAALRSAGEQRQAAQVERSGLEALAAAAPLVRAGQAIAGGDLAGAERLVRPYLRDRPDDPVALSMLAEIAARLGVDSEAEGLLERALAGAPSYLEARLSLSRLLFRQGRIADSNAILDTILAEDPGNVSAAKAKGAALGQVGEYEEAIRTYERLLEQVPDAATAWMVYGHVLKTVGRLEDSLAAYRRALALDPALGEVWWSLANLKIVRLGREEVAALKAALAKPSLETNNRLHLHFALGKSLEDTGEYEESFRHYEEGNRLRRSMLPHDQSVVSGDVRRSKAFFTRAFFATHAAEGCPAADPIFIVGMPRAGSTLIEQILSSHSMVEGTSELPYIPVLARGLLAERWRSRVPFPEILAELDSAQIAALGEAYLERARPHRKTDRPFFIDKLPNNWSDIGFIHLILPRARIIDARRHPLGCCFSNFKQHFAQGQSFSYSLRDLGLYYRDYLELLCHFDETVPGLVHRVVYERMVEDSEGEIRRLLDYLELPFEPPCLRFWENDRAVRTASSEQVRRPINRDGVHAWKPYEPWLGPLKAALGPALETDPEAPAR
jgi:tetratricopeptide (TPR) repeat protein